MRLLVLGVIVLLGACSDGDVPVVGDGAAPPPAVTAADLCVSSDCGEAVLLLAIPDAENLLFSDDGRLFVSGGQNVYEITKAADGTFSATPLYDGTCSFTGLAILDGWLYANGCADHSLLAAQLTAAPKLEKIYQYTGFCIPNGMTDGPDGKLYLVDEPLVGQAEACFVADPKIVRITLNGPTQVAGQETWLQGSPAGLLWLTAPLQDDQMRFPNGLARDGDTFYATDGGTVFSVELQADGSAGPVMPLFWEPTAHDDLGLVDGGILVSDFFFGRVLLLSRDGALLQETPQFTFTAASSVRLARPPMFEPTDILVTDKGVIGDNDLPLDYLVLFRRRQ